MIVEHLNNIIKNYLVYLNSFLPFKRSEIKQNSGGPGQLAIYSSSEEPMLVSSSPQNKVPFGETSGYTVQGPSVG